MFAEVEDVMRRRAKNNGRRMIMDLPTVHGFQVCTAAALELELNFQALYDVIMALQGRDLPPAGRMLESLIENVDTPNRVISCMLKQPKHLYTAWVRSEASKLNLMWDYLKRSCHRSANSRGNRLNTLKKLMRSFQSEWSPSKSSKASSGSPSSISPASAAKRRKMASAVASPGDDLPADYHNTHTEEIVIHSDPEAIESESQAQIVSDFEGECQLAMFDGELVMLDHKELPPSPPQPDCQKYNECDAQRIAGFEKPLRNKKRKAARQAKAGRKAKASAKAKAGRKAKASAKAKAGRKAKGIEIVPRSSEAAADAGEAVQLLKQHVQEQPAGPPLDAVPTIARKVENGCTLFQVRSQGKAIIQTTQKAFGEYTEPLTAELRHLCSLGFSKDQLYAMRNAFRAELRLHAD